MTNLISSNIIKEFEIESDFIFFCLKSIKEPLIQIVLLKDIATINTTVVAKELKKLIKNINSYKIDINQYRDESNGIHSITIDFYNLLSNIIETSIPELSRMEAIFDRFTLIIEQDKNKINFDSLINYIKLLHESKLKLNSDIKLNDSLNKNIDKTYIDIQKLKDNNAYEINLISKEENKLCLLLEESKVINLRINELTSFIKENNNILNAELKLKFEEVIINNFENRVRLVQIFHTLAYFYISYCQNIKKMITNYIKSVEELEISIKIDTNYFTLTSNNINNLNQIEYLLLVYKKVAPDHSQLLLISNSLIDYINQLILSIERRRKIVKHNLKNIKDFAFSLNKISKVQINKLISITKDTISKISISDKINFYWNTLFNQINKSAIYLKIIDDISFKHFNSKSNNIKYKKIISNVEQLLNPLKNELISNNKLLNNKNDKKYKDISNKCLNIIEEIIINLKNKGKSIFDQESLILNEYITHIKQILSTYTSNINEEIININYIKESTQLFDFLDDLKTSFKSIINRYDVSENLINKQISKVLKKNEFNEERRYFKTLISYDINQYLCHNEDDMLISNRISSAELKNSIKTNDYKKINYSKSNINLVTVINPEKQSSHKVNIFNSKESNILITDQNGSENFTKPSKHPSKFTFFDTEENKVKDTETNNINNEEKYESSSNDSSLEDSDSAKDEKFEVFKSLDNIELTKPNLKEKQIKLYIEKMNENKLTSSNQENIIDSFNCAYFDKILLQGKMSITTNKIIFDSIFNNRTLIGSTRLSIPIGDIEKIEKQVFGLLDNSILITTNKKKLLFTSYVSRDDCYDIINIILKDYHFYNSNGISNKKLSQINEEYDNEVEPSAKITKSYLLKYLNNQFYVSNLNNKLKEVTKIRLDYYSSKQENTFRSEEFYSNNVLSNYKISNLPVPFIFNYIYDYRVVNSNLNKNETFYKSLYLLRNDHSIQFHPSSDEMISNIPSYFTDLSFSLNLFSNQNYKEINKLIESTKDWSDGIIYSYNYTHPIEKKVIGPSELSLKDEFRVNFISPSMMIVEVRTYGIDFIYADCFVSYTQYIFNTEFNYNQDKGSIDFSTFLKVNFQSHFVKSCLFSSIISKEGLKEANQNVKYSLIPMIIDAIEFNSVEIFNFYSILFNRAHRKIINSLKVNKEQSNEELNLPNSCETQGPLISNDSIDSALKKDSFTKQKDNQKIYMFIFAILVLATGMLYIHKTLYDNRDI